jgi:4-amino-4-deoxy-L-arabinose transferase-like glycosyltransferase
MVSTAPSSTPSATLVTQRALRILPYALIFIAFLVRLQGLTFQSLWRDEVDAICFAQAPLRAQWPDTARSFTPTCPPDIPDLMAAFTQPGFNGPLYFLLLRGWIGLAGYSEFALRFLSLACGVMSVALIITLGTRLFNRVVGLIAGALLTFSAYQVWYSQEAKMYTLITLLALAAIYFLRRGVEEGRARFWIGAVVCTTVAMAAHILAALLIPVEVILFLTWWTHSRKHLVAGGVMLLCVTVPYLPLGLERLQWVFQPAATGFASYSLPEMLNVLGGAYTRGILNSVDGQLLLIVTGLAAALAVFGLLSLDVAARSDPRRDRALLRAGLLAWLLLPALTIWLISINRPLFTDRYLIWIQSAFYLLIAVGIVAVWQWLRPLAVLVLIVLIVTNSIGILTQATNSFKSDFRSAAQAIGRDFQPADAIMFQIPYVQYNFDYYFRQPYPALSGLYTNQPGPNNGYLDGDEAVLAQVQQLLANQSTVWLVWSEAPMWDQRDLVRRWLNEHGRVTFQAEYPQMQVTRYELSTK